MKQLVTITEAPNILCSISRNHTFDSVVIYNTVKFLIPSLDKDDFVKRVAKGLQLRLDRTILMLGDGTIHYLLLVYTLSVILVI